MCSVVCVKQHTADVYRKKNAALARPNFVWKPHTRAHDTFFCLFQNWLMSKEKTFVRSAQMMKKKRIISNGCE